MCKYNLVLNKNPVFRSIETNFGLSKPVDDQNTSFYCKLCNWNPVLESVIELTIIQLQNNKRSVGVQKSHKNDRHSSYLIA